MTSSQDFLPITDIRNSLIFLSDGSVTAVIKTSAVNFALLSEPEQISIIESFAGLLNSLSFAIQIVIRSERLDVSSYLTLLDKAFEAQKNPLLKGLIPHYRAFVQKMIQENDVLDKQFYVAVNVTVPELGLATKSVEDKTRKAITILTPRLDHLFRQLGRIGLKSTQLETEDLIKFFYDAYNATPDQLQVNAPMEEAAPQVVTASAPQPQPAPQPQVIIPRPATTVPTVAPQAAPRPVAPVQVQVSAPPLPYRQGTSPFVVEELPE